MRAEAGNPRAFVVEDEPPIRELLRVHLELAGYAVEVPGSESRRPIS
jgi:DNA-binding response OmpR family regulator